MLYGENWSIKCEKKRHSSSDLFGPSNKQLLATIKDAINRDGKVGLAIVGGLAVGAAALIAILKK